MKKILKVGVLCSLLSACAINPYTAPPPTCEGVFAEMQVHNDRIARAGRLGAVRDTSVMVGGVLVAAEVLNPLYALVGTVLTSLDIKTGGNEKRRDLLWQTAMERKCW